MKMTEKMKTQKLTFHILVFTYFKLTLLLNHFRKKTDFSLLVDYMYVLKF